MQPKWHEVYNNLVHPPNIHAVFEENQECYILTQVTYTDLSLNKNKHQEFLTAFTAKRGEGYLSHATLEDWKSIEPTINKHVDVPVN